MFNFQINPKLVHWDNEDTYIFVNPNLSKEEQMLIKVNKIPLQHKGLIWVGSSGTTAENSYKLIGLSKQAFLASAKSVCKRLEITKDDIWLSILPRFHVAGLAVEARSYVSGCKINALNTVKFNAQKFVDLLANYNVTVTSIVPTQAFEIIKYKLQAPKKVRFLYIGGAHLSTVMRSQLIDLGWPVVVTYGMTEAASSVATSQLVSRLDKKITKMYLLDHVQAKVTEAQELKLKSESLADFEILFIKGKEPKLTAFDKNKFRLTQDFVELNDDQSLHFLSRKNRQVKISGELVNIGQLNKSFEDFKMNNELLFLSKIKSGRHPKYGHQVELYVEGLETILDVEGLVSKFNASVPRFQKIKSVFFMDKLEKSSISKII